MKMIDTVKSRGRTGRGSRQKGVEILKRRMAQLLIFVMLVSVFQGYTPPHIFANASEGKASASNASKVTWKEKATDDIQISVLSDQTSYSAGDTVCVDVYIKNNSGHSIHNGVLKYSGQGVESDSAYFEELDNVYQEPTTEAAPETTVADTEKTDAENTEADAEDAETTVADDTKEAEKPAPEESQEIFIIEDEPVPVAGSMPETTAAAETTEKEAEEADSNEDGPVDKLTEIDLNPGQIYYTQFYFTVDEDINTIKTQKMTFRFSGKTEEDKTVSAREIFQYAVGGLNLEPIQFSEDDHVLTNEEYELTFNFDLGSIQDMIEEAALDADEASPSNAAYISWEADKASASNIGKKDMLVRDIVCQLETYGLKLKNFHTVTTDDSNEDEMTVTVAFRIASGTKPGTYFGKATTSYKVKGKGMKSTQGFKVVVEGAGDVTLNGKIGNTEVIVTGPAESFPEAEELSIQVSEVDEDKQQLVEDVIQKKAEDDGIAINRYRALDIKLFADGVETEPTGEIQVAFKNVKLKDKETGKDTPISVLTEGSLETEITDPAAVPMAMSEDAAAGDAVQDTTETDAPQTGTITEAAPEIKVLHLDEELGDTNEMSSSVENNGDVVMTTDHFSVYILVALENISGTATLTIQHYATVDVLDENPDSAFAPGNTELSRTAKYCKIYSNDTETLENGTSVNIDSISKVKFASVSGNSNYVIDKVWMWHGTGAAPDAAEKPEEANWYDITNDNSRLIAGNTVIRVEYTQNTAKVQEVGTTQFYDYDVMGDGDLNATTINAVRNYPTKGLSKNTKFLSVSYVSRPDNDRFSTDANNYRVATLTKDIVTGLDSSNNPEFNPSYRDAGWFTDETKIGKYIVRDGTDRELEFNQSGDTYILSSVSNTAVENLDEIQYKTNSSGTKLYVNGFWPVDNFDGHKDKTDVSVFKTVDGVPHNLYFGMRYSFKFTLGDYVGPLNFYFRGDDDFWLFVDKKLALDIGGIHDAVGGSLNLYDKISDSTLDSSKPNVATIVDPISGKTYKVDKTKEYTITILYMERGGYASTCYMEFMIPNLQKVPPIPVSNKASLTVKKEWNDTLTNHDEVKVDVYYRLNNSTSDDWRLYRTDPLVLNASNGWKQEIEVHKDIYQYKIVERAVNGYVTSYSTDGGIVDRDKSGNYSATVTNTPTYNLTISKKVAGNMGDHNASFPFQIKIQRMIGSSSQNVTSTVVSGLNGFTVQRDGQEEYAEFSLTNNGTQFIPGLMKGDKITVTETGATDYVTTVGTVGEAGVVSVPTTSKEFIVDAMNGNMQIQFTNTKQVDIPTGVTTGSRHPYLMMFALAAFSVMGFGFTGFRRKRREEQ